MIVGGTSEPLAFCSVGRNLWKHTDTETRGVITNSLSSFPSCQNGNTALAIARRLGYISVVDTLKVVTEETMTTTVSIECRPHQPESQLSGCRFSRALGK